MEEWQPQIIIVSFFVVGALLSYFGAIMIEKIIDRIRHRLQTFSSRTPSEEEDMIKRVN
ncbi:hypothetical protein SAMN05444487_11618 [Marininema mesophilum]|uniref:Uncharacterized protein n=1 Tax=Marininema mesophilum TaxID=1048340 RepID=A0A1H3BA80_9BACL|nr:hypothetical protein [Marininema mesophilum]SDX38541.1 hypothetical protein SAMN05444487_11618 [Marininema mesophilum]